MFTEEKISVLKKGFYYAFLSTIIPKKILSVINRIQYTNIQVIKKEIIR